MSTQFALVALAVVGVLVGIVVLAGAVVTIVSPSSLSFHDYVTDLTILASALAGALGVAFLKLKGQADEPAKDADA
jgi:hypothetical protein